MQRYQPQDLDLYSHEISLIICAPEHQQYLYNTIQELHKKKLGYQKISNWFNERNIKTPRGSEFQGNYVFSILKKGRIREERLNRESKWKIEEIKINLC